MLSIVSSLAPYYFIARIVTKLLMHSTNKTDYIILVICMAAAFLLKGVFHSISTLYSHKATFEILANIRKKCTDKLAKMPLGDVLSIPVGNLKSTILERVDSIEVTLAHVVPEFTSNIIAPIVILILIFMINWKLGIATLVVLPIGFVFFLGMMKGYEKNFGRVLKATKNLNDTTIEYIHGIEVIKVFGKAEESYEKFTDAAVENADAYISWMKKINIYFTFSLVIMPATMITVLPIGALMLAHGTIMLSDMINVIIYAVALIDPIITMLSFKDDIEQIGVVVSEINTILGAKELVRPSDETKVELKDSSIRLSDVHFGYQSEEILHGINIDIKDKEYIALVGPSGSGKSTIAKLIAGMWDVDSGSIMLGGVDVKNIPMDTYQDRIAYVSQENYLFNISVRENIRMGKTTGYASDEEVEEVAKKSGCHDFIMSLENGYDTIVGSGGGHLSGGEKQRISIARAMLKNAQIVILDEATAYTDPENEALVQESVAKLVQGKTLIVIAHRLSTITSADKIYCINKGNIEEFGTHEELLNKDGLYKKMWMAHINAKDREGVKSR